MKLSDPPRPLAALIAAVVAHVAYLQAPDAVGQRTVIGWYLAAILGVGYFLLFLLGQDQGRFANEVRHLLSQGVAMLGSVLILVGAGYSTNVEPTVLKLCGVLPLGWSCAVTALLKEQTKLLAQTLLQRRNDRDLSWLTMMLCLFTVLQFACDLGVYQKGSGEMIKWALEMWLFVGLFDLGLTWWRMTKAVAAKKD